ncbi:glycosyltransferase family 2 protein [Halomonas sp. CS7]|uniref:Glycosyltransferase family 2 protein n=1 Tax=Halomonas pelophila TaxID=3151122 RepID=A0ABV1NBD3_9GAMM
MKIKSNNSPLVSVMMPVYNGGGTIARALHSLITQSYTNWNAVIVDDGSTDNTQSVVKSFNDSRISLISHSVNRGRAAARQTALHHVTGDYVAYLDADDFYHPEKLERQVEFLERNYRADYCGCGLGSFKSGEGLIRVRAVFSFNDVRHRSGKPIFISPISSMIRSSVAVEHKYKKELTYGEDMEYFQRALDNRLLGCIPDVLYYYSEFDDVNASKLISSYFPILRNNVKKIKSSPCEAFVSLLSCCFRFAMVSATCAIFGHEKILLRRGRAPSDEEIDEFIKVSKSLEVDNSFLSVS